MVLSKYSSVLFLLGCTTAIYSQQAHTLTDQDVQVAIQKAYMKPHDIGLHLSTGCGIESIRCASTGFSVHLYTPSQWIESKAMDAKEKLLSYTLADVTTDMREPVLRVHAGPDTPRLAYAQGSSVQRVVLADASKQTLVEATSNEKLDVTTENAFRTRSYSGVIATFSMEDLKKVRGSDGNGEFYVIVVGDYNKEFKVKSKMFSKLF